jgi:RHS repeat-associated protein
MNLSLIKLRYINITDSEIIFYNPQTKEKIFSISAPLMWDNNESYSSNIKISIIEENNKNILKIIPDNEWLNDEKRSFPITIDPTVTTSPATAAIQDCYIYNGDTNNSTKCTAHVLRVGNAKWSETNKSAVRSVIKFNLPELQSGDQVTNAKFSIYSYKYSLEGWETPTPEIEVDIHQLLTSWTTSNANWSRLGATTNYDTRVADYFLFKYNTTNEIKRYDANITRIVKDWYQEGGNYGIMLKSLEGSTSMNADSFYFSSGTSSTYTSKRPVIQISYRNQTGLEDYQTFSSNSFGRNDVYVNNYNGNLAISHYDASTPGGRLPASINHIYNTNDATDNIGFGMGFRLNITQKLVTDGTLIKYIDEDATRHWFYKSGSIYKDESGLSLTLTPSGNDYIMEDKGGNKSTFTKYGTIWFLTKIKDTNDNEIQINYNSTYTQILNVIDGASKELTFTYNTEGLLSKITDLDGREITYAYDSTKRLISITYPDLEVTTYTYNTNNFITRITNIDGSYQNFGYYSSKPYRLKATREYSTDAVSGTGLNFEYGENTTKITDYLGRTNIYSFDNVGRTLNITDLGKETTPTSSYGVSFQYETDTNSSKTNKLKLESDLIKSTNNYVLNPDARSNSNSWTVHQSGTPGTLSIDTTEKYIGNKSFKISTSTATNTYPFNYQRIDLEAGKTYTLSMYIKGNLEEITDESSGVVLNFEYKDAQGIWYREYKVIQDVTSNFERYTYTFTVPSNMDNSSTISFGIRNAMGVAYFDAIQLEEGDIANPYNLVENGAFLRGESGWSRSSTLTTADLVGGSGTYKYFRFAGTPRVSKGINQFIDINGKEGDTFNVSFWGLNKGVPRVDVTTAATTTTGISISKQTRLVFEFEDLNGTIVQKTEIHVPSDVNGWQYISDTIVAEQDFKRIKITPTYNNQKSYSYYTNIGVYKDEGANTYTYDSNGNIVSNSDSVNSETYEYDEEDQLTSITTPEGTVDYEYDPDSENRLIEAVTDEGMSSNFEYDEYGNLTKSIIKENDREGLDEEDKKYMENTSEYSSDGRYQISSTDERGNTTSINYNENRGTTTSIEDPNENLTSYTYDTMDNLLSVTNGDTTNSYEYNEDALTKINHNGFSYNFVYDTFGNITNIKVGNQSLVTNTYAENNGNLLSSTYGNSSSINYTYDQFDRITKITNDTGDIKYNYDNRGNISILKDDANNIEKKFTYNLSGDVTEYTENNTYKIKYSYNQYSNLSRTEYNLNNITKQTNYVYDDNLKLSSINNTSYSYDGFDRLSSKKISNTYETKYNYLDLSNNKTTSLIESIENSTNKLSYEYDDNGNITRVLENNIETNKYYYDNLNQLIKEDDKSLNKTIEYNYDNGGNILSKDYYEYKTETLINTIEYEYNNNNWKDQLTKYNNKTITYDQIGNPLSIGNDISLSWINGRSLESYTDTSNNLEVLYKYNEDGIRIEKEVNGITTKYYLEGTNIIYEDRDGEIIYYNYDSTGVSGVTYQNNEYYFIKNIQGDIIGILDEEFNQIVSYTYDSWGNIISIIDENGSDISNNTNHIGNINPFKYRSYYYDNETNLYYLNSRYYNPEMGRFVNADNYVSTDSGIIRHNMYLYANNNAIILSDSNGTTPTISISIGVTIGGVSLKGALGGLIASNPVGWAILAAAIGVIAIGTSIYYGGKILPKSKAINNSDIVRGLNGLAGAYGLYQCHKAANALKKYLQNLKKNGAIIQLTFPSKSFVLSNKSIRQSISTNGIHFGVLYKGRVYCNIYPNGLPEFIWIKSFYDATGRPPIVTKYYF